MLPIAFSLRDLLGAGIVSSLGEFRGIQGFYFEMNNNSSRLGPLLQTYKNGIKKYYEEEVQSRGILAHDYLDAINHLTQKIADGHDKIGSGEKPRVDSKDSKSFPYIDETNIRLIQVLCLVDGKDPNFFEDKVLLNHKLAFPFVIWPGWDDRYIFEHLEELKKLAEEDSFVVKNRGIENITSLLSLVLAKMYPDYYSAKSPDSQKPKNNEEVKSEEDGPGRAPADSYVEIRETQQKVITRSLS